MTFTSKRPTLWRRRASHLADWLKHTFKRKLVFALLEHSVVFLCYLCHLHACFSSVGVGSEEKGMTENVCVTKCLNVLSALCPQALLSGLIEALNSHTHNKHAPIVSNKRVQNFQSRVFNNGSSSGNIKASLRSLRHTAQTPSKCDSQKQIGYNIINYRKL